MALHKLIFDTTSATTRADSHTVGAVLYDAANDRLGVINASNQLEVHDADVLSQLQSGVVVSATDLDIRDLTHVSDSIKVGDGTDFLAVNADGSINITDNGGSLTVDATDLDIRDLTAASDSVQANMFDGAGTALTSTLVGADQALDVNLVQSVEIAINDGGNTITVDGTVGITGDVNVTQGTSPWVIGDGGGSITVDATDLDIRDLAHTQDSIRLGDGTSLITSTLEGSKQALDVYVANSIDVDDGLANTAIATAANTLTTGGTAQDLVASPLASRKYLFVYNNDNQTMYIGATGVTAANGFPVPPGSLLELRAGASVDIEFNSAKTGLAVRTMELS